MFHNNSNRLEGATTPTDNVSAFQGLNMYLEASPPASVSTLSPPATPMTPEPGMLSATSASTQFPLLTDNVSVSAASTAATAAANTLFLQRQYQYQLFQLQRQQQELALAQHQLVLAASAASAAAANHQQKDEIAHSLKMFALITACNAENSGASTQDAMQEFAANGYDRDDLNYLQSYGNQTPPTPSSPSTPLPQPFPINVGNVLGGPAALTPLAAAHWLNLNTYTEQLNMWRSMSMSYIPNVGSNVGLGMASTSQQNINVVGVPAPADTIRNATNKVPKRFGNGKSKEYIPRHCVFCENNNEPEAVVNSHSVRDSYGRVLCPRLRTYVCPICGASGDSAHTIKYCPKKPIITMEDAVNAESYRLAKSNYYKQQMKV